MESDTTPFDMFLIFICEKIKNFLHDQASQIKKHILSHSHFFKALITVRYFALSLLPIGAIVVMNRCALFSSNL